MEDAKLDSLLFMAFSRFLSVFLFFNLKAMSSATLSGAFCYVQCFSLHRRKGPSYLWVKKKMAAAVVVVVQKLK